MNLARRTELCIACGAFAALGLAFCWQAVTYWRTGVVFLLRFTSPIGPGSATAAAVGLGALGIGTMLAAALVLRARWTPPPPGEPVEPAPDRT